MGPTAVGPAAVDLDRVSPDRVGLDRVSLDRVGLALLIVFLAAAAFYVWTAATSSPLALSGPYEDRYNALAAAILHGHLWVLQAPAGLLALAEPYDPVQNQYFRSAFGLHDAVLYHGYIYLTWGPAPVLTLLVPLRLLGLKPSVSVVAATFAVIGLGFALGTLRILLRQLSESKLWIATLTGWAVALCSMVPFILRRPYVYEEAIVAGYCFAMAGAWLAISALARKRFQLPRLALMSLCFGLATGSRPTLGLTALLLLPVYLPVRRAASSRWSLPALLAPFGACLLLLLAYNQARFGSLSEFGTKYVLGGWNSQVQPLADPRYVPPGVWYYMASPPRPMAVFPFVELDPPPLSYPFATPGGYAETQSTGGLLPMVPIVVFAAALPWLWRRRPGRLGSLTAPLLVWMTAGVGAMLYLSLEFPSTVERYTVDFYSPLLLGGLAGWLAVSKSGYVAKGHVQTGHVRLRRLLRGGGTLLVAWGCLMALAVSFKGQEYLLSSEHPATWARLERFGSPLSGLIATIAGHPVLVSLAATDVTASTPVHYSSLSLGPTATAFVLRVNEPATLSIASPGSRKATLAVRTTSAISDNASNLVNSRAGASAVSVAGPGQALHVYPISPNGGELLIPLQLDNGLNRVVLVPVAKAPRTRRAAAPPANQLLVVKDLTLK